MHVQRRLTVSLRISYVIQGQVIGSRLTQVAQVGVQQCRQVTAWVMGRSQTGADRYYYTHRYYYTQVLLHTQVYRRQQLQCMQVWKILVANALTSQLPHPTCFWKRDPVYTLTLAELSNTNRV